MNEIFMNRCPVITVAVSFDRHTMVLTEAAAELCRRTGKTLCLLHVVEPWLDHAHSSRPLGPQDPLWNVNQAVETSARDLAQNKLEELAQMIPANIPVIKRIVSGKPVDMIIKEVVDTSSAMLIVGADFGNLKFVPRGLSTALSLMVSSPVPVLVADGGSLSTTFNSKSRFLIADDLGIQSESAVDFGYGLATALRGSHVQHIHISGLTLDNLQAGLATAAASSHTPLNTKTSASDVFSAINQDLKNKLQRRAEKHLDLLEASEGQISMEVLTGSVYDQLAEYSTKHNPHIIVFGRHHAYYTKPFFIGRLPYRTMLALKRPVILVPNEGEAL
jgi:nucleotide-binding universal stress UspA family protein